MYGFYLYLTFVCLFSIAVLTITGRKRTRKTYSVSNYHLELPDTDPNEETNCFLGLQGGYKELLLGTTDIAADDRYIPVADTGGSLDPAPRYQPLFHDMYTTTSAIDSSGGVYVGVYGPFATAIGTAPNSSSFVGDDNYSAVFKLNTNLVIDNSFGSPYNMAGQLDVSTTIGHLFVYQTNWKIVAMSVLGDNSIVASFDDNTNTQIVAKFLPEGHDTDNLPNAYDTTFGTGGYTTAETGTITSMAVSDDEAWIFTAGENVGGFFIDLYTSGGAHQAVKTRQFYRNGSATGVTNSVVTSVKIVDRTVYVAGTAEMSGVQHPALASFTIENEDNLVLNPSFSTNEVFELGVSNHGSPSLVVQPTRLVVTSHIGADVKAYGFTMAGATDASFATGGVLTLEVSTDFTIGSVHSVLSKNNGFIMSGIMTDLEPKNKFWLVSYDESGQTILSTNISEDEPVSEYKTITSASYHDGTFIMTGSVDIDDRQYSAEAEDALATTKGMVTSFSCR